MTLFRTTSPPTEGQPARYTLLYLVFGVLWILLSDWAVEHLVPTPQLRAMVQTSKGTLYVALTGLFVFLLLRRLQQSLLAAHRRQAELTAHYQVLFDRNPQPMLILSEIDHRILVANAAAQRFYGMDRAALLALRLEDLLADPKPATPVHETRAGVPLAARHVAHDGQVADVEVHQTQVRLENGSSIWIVMVADVTTRLMQAQALARSEVRFRRIVETAVEGVWVMDAEGLTTYVNEQMAAMLGYRCEEMLGRPVADFMDAEGRKQLRQNMARRRMGINERHEFPFLHSHGHLVWTIVATTAFLDADSQFEGALAMVTDISELKQKSALLEEQAAALRENEQRFRVIASVTNDLLWDWDVVHDVHWRSEGFADILGLTGGNELPFDRWRERLHPDDRDRVSRSLHEVLQGRETAWDAEYRIRRIDGGWAHIRDRAHILRDGDGAALRMIGGMTDVTQRREHELKIQQLNEQLEQRVQERTEELRRSELLHRTLTDAAPQVIWMADPLGQWTFLNPAWQRLTGEPPEAGLGTGWMQMVHPTELTMVSTAWDHARRNGIVFQTECRFRLPNESWGYVSCLGVPVRDQQGHVVRWVGVNTDITARKQAEEEIRNLNEELRVRGEKLEASNRELEAFAYSISHDLRAPLRHIEGFAGMLVAQASAHLDEVHARYLRNIMQSAGQMGRMIEELLAFSRIGRCEVNMRHVDLNLVVQDLIAEFATELDGRDVDWRVAPLPEVQGDPDLLRLVISNLLTNAIKFTRPRPQARIELGAVGGRPGERVVFVRDNGVGFDMKDGHRLFRVFQRLHRAEDFEGTGIGLANVQRIILRHGGRVWAESAQGQGAAFFIALPAHEQTPH